MADALLARTALGSEAGSLRTHGLPGVLTLSELVPTGMIDLRCDPADKAVMATAQNALGFELPTTPGKSNAHGSREALWFGPDQWLIVAPAADVATILGTLDSGAVSATDVSDLRAAFELKGPHATDVLRKGCGIDLHPRAFGPGDCALTALARTRIALLQIDKAPTYRVWVERSVATYLWDWLVDAMMSFIGQPTQPPGS
jgi:sarcosine oxidase subunit gamma